MWMLRALLLLFAIQMLHGAPARENAAVFESSEQNKIARPRAERENEVLEEYVRWAKGSGYAPLSNATVLRLLPMIRRRFEDFDSFLIRADVRMRIKQAILVLLYFGIHNVVSDGESSSEIEDDGDDYEPPMKRLKTSCYFGIPRSSPLERNDRNHRHKVSTKCNGELLSMSKLAQNVDGKLFGAPHELAFTLHRGEATFLDEYSNLEPWDDEVICERHLNELSRQYFNDEFGHIKKVSGPKGKIRGCGYPEQNHTAQAPRYSMSYQMSKNFLYSDNVLRYARGTITQFLSNLHRLAAHNSHLSIPKTTIKGISTLGHFQFDGDTISAWRFRGIGEGMKVHGLKGIKSTSDFPTNGGKVSRDGLKEEDKQKIANEEEPFYWFFPTKNATSLQPDEPETGDVHDEAVTGEIPPVTSSDPTTQALFICSKCSASFIRHSNLLRHHDKGDHKIRPEKVTMYDFALGLFKRMLEEVQQAVNIGPLSESFKEYEEAPKDPRPMGWALPTKKKSARYNPAANKMVTDLFEERFRQNKKLRADEAEKLMRERKDISPADRMTHDQIKNRIRTLLAKKKEEQEKHHRNRQRRTVAQIADWIKDSEEEGGVIEEEVDVVHDDDLTIPSDAIYDMVHGMMDVLFVDPSQPIFSNIDQFEQ